MKAKSGTYALIFQLARPLECEVGSLGRVRLDSGYYVYVGSAFGPGGVKARTDHHRKLSQRPHWHLDYLRPHLQLLEIWGSYDPVPREHLWAATLAAMRGASLPLPGFGSSDCRCTSHLIRLGYKPSLAGFRRRIRKKEPGHAPVHGEILEPPASHWV
jgi:Uri superfamily endonuclease